MKLKPVVFVKGLYSYNRQNTFQQCLLLEAMKVTQDPKKLKTLIGVKSVAEVYRTLDKMAMRKEYHEALAEEGIDFGFIIKGIKGICKSEKAKEGDKLRGYQTLLTSLGMDKYEGDGATGGNWEDALIKINDAEKERPKELKEADEDYEVNLPEVPEKLKKQKKAELDEGRSIYE